MDPQNQELTSSFELPPARAGDQAAAQLSELQAKSEEQSTVAIERGTSGQPAPSVTQAMPQQTLPPGQISQQMDPPGVVAVTSAPQIADDTDLIEKEWVTIAKEIVARTTHDPHLQNKEMNKFKADYLKKRYNKEIKLGEDT